MLDASHALIGASLAKLIPNPYLGLPLSLISHFLTDLIPHWDLHTRSEPRPKTQLIMFSLCDAGLGYLLGYLLFPQVSFYYLMSMMFVAQLPDWLEAPFHVFHWHFPPFSSIKKLQSRLHCKLGLPWGLITQVLTILAFVFLAQLV
jgi:hypothetical protein